MSKYVDMIGQDDAPHLNPPIITVEEREALMDDMLPHEAEARRTGMPSLGAGAIYPVDTELLFIPPFQLPDYYTQGWALDPGWRVTAALLGAYDPETEKYYLTAEYYGMRDQPVVHAAGIKAMLPWETLEGQIDPSSDNVGNLKDGAKMKEEYEDLDLVLTNANNAVHAGLRHILILMQTGRLKIFETLVYLKKELRLYRRDEKGKIVKANDHLMDDMRYLLNTDDAFHDKPIQRVRRRARGEW